MNTRTASAGWLLLFLIPSVCIAGWFCGVSTAAEQPGLEQNICVAPAASPDCGKILEAIEQQRAMYVRETGQLKREIAALRQELTNPGLKDIAAGIGYIFGITGLAFYFRARSAARGKKD